MKLLNDYIIMLKLACYLNYSRSLKEWTNSTFVLSLLFLFDAVHFVIIIVNCEMHQNALKAELGVH